MKHSFSSVLTLLCVFGSVTSSYAVKFPFKKRALGIRSHEAPRHGASAGKISSAWTGNSFLAHSDAEDDNEIGNFQNKRYTTNISVNGKEFHVVLDTGSTDLWVISDNLGEYSNSGIELSLLYGDGTYGVNGTIGTAPFEFGPYKIEHQAFLHARDGTIGGLTDLGLNGLLGLGLNTREASPIGNKIKEVEGEHATWGDSVLENLFRQHPEQPNFIGFDLVRTEDMEDSADGSFTIGEYDEDYLDIQNFPKLPKFPKDSYRWTIVVDEVLVNGKSIPLESNVASTPKGHAVALLDTGGPINTLPTRVVDGIYSQISGAVKYDNEDGPMWIVPCNSTETVEFVFSGIKVPIHPLDLTNVIPSVDLFGTNYNFCIAAAKISDDFGGSEFDMLLGDNFLRNVYSVYDFGDYMSGGTLGEPYIQLLSKTNIEEARDQLLSVRDHILHHSNEIPPSELIKLIAEYDKQNPDPSTTSDSTGSANGQGNDKEDSTTGRIVSNVASANGDDDTNATIRKYGPIALGLLAANLLVGLILIILGILNYIRKGKPSRSVAPAYIPVKVRDEEVGHIGHYQDNTRYSQ